MPRANRPHAHLRTGALTFPDVANRSFRREATGDWRDLLPYSAAGFAVGWVLLGLLAWWM